MSSYDEKPIISKYTQQFNNDNSNNSTLNKTSDLKKEQKRNLNLQVPANSILKEYPYLKIQRDSFETDSLASGSLPKLPSSATITYSISSRNDSFDEKPILPTFEDKPVNKQSISLSEKHKQHIKVSPSSRTSENTVRYSPNKIQIVKQPVKFEQFENNTSFERVNSQEDIIIIRTPHSSRNSTELKRVRILEPVQEPIIMHRLPPITSGTPVNGPIVQNAQSPRKIVYVSQPRQSIQPIVTQSPAPVFAPQPKIVKVVHQAPKVQFSLPPEPERKPSPVLLFHDGDSQNFENNSNLNGRFSRNRINSNDATKSFGNRLDAVNNILDGYYYTNIDYSNGSRKNSDENNDTSRQLVQSNQNGYLPVNQQFYQRPMVRQSFGPNGAYQQVIVPFSQYQQQQDQGQQNSEPFKNQTNQIENKQDKNSKQELKSILRHKPTLLETFDYPRNPALNFKY